MKIAALIARLLLGFLFAASGLFAILRRPKPTAPDADALAYLTILTTHNYLTFVAVLMLVAGILLLVGRFVPLGLTILGPILVNILLFHILLEPKGIIPGLIATVLEIFLIWVYRLSFRGLFDAAPEIA